MGLGSPRHWGWLWGWGPVMGRGPQWYWCWGLAMGLGSPRQWRLDLVMGLGPQSMGTGVWLWGWDPHCIGAGGWLWGWDPMARVLGLATVPGSPWHGCWETTMGLGSQWHWCWGLAMGLGPWGMAAGSQLWGRGLLSVGAVVWPWDWGLHGAGVSMALVLRSSCGVGVSKVRGLGSQHYGVAIGSSHGDGVPMVWRLRSSPRAGFPRAWVLGSGCGAGTPRHGCWGSHGMDAKVCSRGWDPAAWVLGHHGCQCQPQGWDPTGRVPQGCRAGVQVAQ